MKNFIVALAALLLPVVAAAQFSLSGKITSKDDGMPLPGATVKLLNTQPEIGTAADKDGNFRFTNLKPGRYSVQVSYVGNLTMQKRIDLNRDLTLDFILKQRIIEDDFVVVTATRASSKSPTAFTNLSKADLEKNNLGQDLPYLLNQTPSVVTSSDAGTGIGYTGIRIRGTDGTRINVTLNGIPYNDAESQGSFFVDLPDFASSVQDIQVQRGVGTSTNGAGAFGGSINIQTTRPREKAYAEINTSGGSYGTVKNTVQAGTGLLNHHFSVDARLSRIASDGYIDYASSNLKSYFLGASYYGSGNLIRANIFSGHERTFQAWNGVPDYAIGDPALPHNRQYNELGIMPNGDRYKDQVDDYTQTHYQLLYDRNLSSLFSFSGALHYTKGSGYYEEFRGNAKLAEYGLPSVVVGNTTIARTNLARRRWLDNDFYGLTYSLKYHSADNALKMTLGGAYNQYDGDHFGNIIYTAQSAGIIPNYEYYRNNAKKNDFNTFGKVEYQAGKFLLYGDLQYRHVYYKIAGPENKNQIVNELERFNFFNPKVGITYDLGNNDNVYASFAVGNREPNRNDYTDVLSSNIKPKSENLKDFEIGYRTSGKTFSGSLNGYYMLYKNQLVLTGQLNDVGSQIRRNVDDSYRAGIEAEGKVRITSRLAWAANATISTNKIKNYTQAFNNFDNNTLASQTFDKTTLAFSPSFIAGSELAFSPVKNGSIALLSKYVSRQYLDNTMNTNPANFTVDPAVASNAFAVNRYLGSYFVNDVRLNYNFSIKSVKNIGITLLVNNVFSKKYESNGATYPDIEGGYVVNYNYFFAQAPRNFLASLNLRF